VRVEWVKTKSLAQGKLVPVPIHFEGEFKWTCPIGLCLIDPYKPEREMVLLGKQRMVNGSDSRRRLGLCAGALYVGLRPLPQPKYWSTSLLVSDISSFY
jgi:hypothetical protein